MQRLGLELDSNTLLPQLTRRRIEFKDSEPDLLRSSLRRAQWEQIISSRSFEKKIRHRLHMYLNN